MKTNRDDILLPLCEAICVLSETTEIEKKDSNKPKEIKELEEAIQSKEPKNIKEKLVAFRKWYNKIEPDKKYRYLHLCLRIVSKLIQYVISISAIFAMPKDAEKVISIIKNKTRINKVDAINLIIVIILYIACILPIKISSYRYKKYNKENAEEEIKRLTNEAIELKKVIDKMDNKYSTEYKSMSKLYDRTIECISKYKKLMEPSKVKRTYFNK